MKDTYGRYRTVPKLLGMVLVMIWIGGWMPTALAQQSEGEICYVALGDSISSGYGLEEDEQMFTQQVARVNGFSLISLAQNGETSETLLERLQDPEAMQAVVQADVITMTIGGNDLMHALYGYLADQYHAQNPDTSPTVEEMQGALMGGDMAMITFALGEIHGFSASSQQQEALAQFSSNLTQVVSKIHTVNPEVYLVVTNQYNPYSYLLREFSKYPPLATAAQDIEEVFETGVAALNEAIASVGEQMGCTVVDVYGAFDQAEENPCNADVSAFAKVNLDFHPNAYGHSLIAQAVTAVTHQQLQVAGHDAQAVNGETTKLVQPMGKRDQWQWAIPLCVGGVSLLGVLIWRWKRRNPKGNE